MCNVRRVSSTTVSPGSRTSGQQVLCLHVSWAGNPGNAFPQDVNAVLCKPFQENTAMAILELTVISASVAPDVQLDLEPKDSYATILCAKEQRSTKRTHDHGRLPVWNETLEFNLGDQDVPKFIFLQLFAVRSDSDGLLGVARIPIFTTGKADASLHVLVSPDKGEIGTLKAAWRWKSIPQTDNLSSYYIKKDERDHNPVLYPPPASTYTDITSAMAQLAVHKGEREPYPPTAYGAVSSTAYPPSHEAEERSTFTSEPYPRPGDLSKTSYHPPSIPYPPTTDAPPYPYYQNSSSSSDAPPDSYYQKTSSAADTPPHPDYQKTSPSSESYFPAEKEGGKPPGSTSRGLGDTTDKGHSSQVPYGYAPPGMYGGGSPPPPPGYPRSDQKTSSSSESYFPAEKEGEESPTRTSRGLGDTTDKGHHSHMPFGYAPPGMYGGGYSPQPPSYPSPYGHHPPGGYAPPPPSYPQGPAYPPAPYGVPPAYPPAPYGVPPAPYGYPPSGSPYPSQPYAPHGYPAPAPYSVHPGHGSYAPGMYVGHSSHGKHSKSFKHQKMPKHGMYQYGHPQPHYGHYKHKKHKGFGKGYKLKKFKF